jgi:1-acyl-sn-glycerol-3-phosphate acyltransferase
MRTIIYFIRFFFVNIETIPNIIGYKHLLKKGESAKAQEYLYQTTKKWATKMFKNSGATATIHNLEAIPEGNFLLVSNHQGNFDIPLLMTYIPRLMGFVAKVELEKVPIISGWMKRMDCVFLDRKNLRQSISMLNSVSKKLKNGQSYALFPEGTRSKSSKMNAFKKGSLRIAVKSGVPILPVTIDGTYRLLEEKGRIVKGHVHVTIHDPIETSNLTKEEEMALNDRIQALIESAIKTD